MLFSHTDNNNNNKKNKEPNSNLTSQPKQILIFCINYVTNYMSHTYSNLFVTNICFIHIIRYCDIVILQNRYYYILVHSEVKTQHIKTF